MKSSDVILDEALDTFEAYLEDPDLIAIRATPLFEGDGAGWHCGKPSDPSLTYLSKIQDGEMLIRYYPSSRFNVDGVIYDPAARGDVTVRASVTSPDHYGNIFFNIKDDLEAISTSARDLWTYHPYRVAVEVFHADGTWRSHTYISVEDPDDPRLPPIRSSP